MRRNHQRATRKRRNRHSYKSAITAISSPYVTSSELQLARTITERRLRARGLSANTLVADGHMRRLCAWWLHAAGRENGRRLRLAGWRIPARRIRPGRPREFSDGHGPGRAVQSSKRVPPGPGRPRGPRRYPGQNTAARAIDAGRVIVR
jgi:hypothetical protein